MSSIKKIKIGSYNIITLETTMLYTGCVNKNRSILKLHNFLNLSCTKKITTRHLSSINKILKMQNLFTSLNCIMRKTQINRYILKNLSLRISILLYNITSNVGQPFSLQQDGTSTHNSCETVAFLSVNVPEFIEPEYWPPNSSDLNLVDYSI